MAENIHESLYTRVRLLEMQTERMQSDIVSEKASRNRLFEDITTQLRRLETRLRSIEKHVYIGVGIFLFLQATIQILTRMILK